MYGLPIIRNRNFPLGNLNIRHIVGNFKASKSRLIVAIGNGVIDNITRLAGGSADSFGNRYGFLGLFQFDCSFAAGNVLIAIYLPIRFICFCRFIRLHGFQLISRHFSIIRDLIASLCYTGSTQRRSHIKGKPIARLGHGYRLPANFHAAGIQSLQAGKRIRKCHRIQIRIHIDVGSIMERVISISVLSGINTLRTILYCVFVMNENRIRGSREFIRPLIISSKLSFTGFNS